MKNKNEGFTLIELMIAVAILGILSAISFQTYTEHVKQSRRVGGQSALVALANAMEQWKMQNSIDRGYLGAAIGGGDIGQPGIYPANVPTSGTPDYELTIVLAEVNSYTLMATPLNVQADDGWLQLDSTGIKSCDSSVLWCSDASGTW
jgi:type IV pilus assembly protein PilE